MAQDCYPLKYDNCSSCVHGRIHAEFVSNMTCWIDKEHPRFYVYAIKEGKCKFELHKGSSGDLDVPIL